jgi:hypothetical protein
MEKICKGLEYGLDVSFYAKPEFTPEQMRIILYGLEINLDVFIYSKPELSHEQMKEIFYTLEKYK